MSKDINSRINDLKARRRGSTSTTILGELNKSFTGVENFEKRANKDWTKYALGIMQEVDKEYTNNSIAEGDRVKNQIKTKIKTPVEFEYQGSVPLNVHIRGVSDIDLLVLHGRYVTIDQKGSRATSGHYSDWTGAPGPDLILSLRHELESILENSFPTAAVNKKGDKAIGLSGGSLARKVDVVPSHWHDSALYQDTLSKKDRGVKVLEKSKHSLFLNRPFMHIEKVTTKDLLTSGGAKKIIRMLKNLKADSEHSDSIKINSYELAGLVYHFDSSNITVPRWNELSLIAATKSELAKMLNNKEKTMSLVTPDEIRRIIDSEEKYYSLALLFLEVHTLAENLARELSQNFILNEQQVIKALKESYIPEIY